MKLQRGQHGNVTSGFDFNCSNGQHGYGVYAFRLGDSKMKEYYTKSGEKLHSFEIPDNMIMDLSKQKLDFWDAKTHIFNNSQCKAFIFKHSGHGIPTSKEILITDPSIIKIK